MKKAKGKVAAARLLSCKKEYSLCFTMLAVRTLKEETEGVFTEGVFGAFERFPEPHCLSRNNAVESSDEEEVEGEEDGKMGKGV